MKNFMFEKIAATSALLLFAAASVAQNDRTGVAKPQPVTVMSAEDSDTQTAAPVEAMPSAAKPSAAIPAAPGPVVYGPYVPYHAPGTQAASTGTTGPAAEAFDPDANIVTEGNSRRPLSDAATRGVNDPDAGIVTHVPTRPNEILDGTLLKVKLREKLSTLTTRPGTRFTAEVSEAVVQDGRVYIPVGSMLTGRVTWVRGGKRIGGPAAIHLEPSSVMLPDGTQLMLHARAIDTSSWENTKVDSEGTISRKEHMKGTLEAGALATGGAMAAGAMIAGVPGALIGAGIGAGATAVVWLKQDRQAELPKDLGVIFSLTAPLTVTPSTAGLPATRTTGGE